MAMSNHDAGLEVANTMIGMLETPGRSQLDVLRRHEGMPPLNFPHPTDESWQMVRVIYDTTLPSEWEKFRAGYNEYASTADLSLQLSWLCAVAQLGRVLLAESVQSGYERAVETSTMVLAYHLDRLVQPVESSVFGKPYDALIPNYDVEAALTNFNHDPLRPVDTYFDTVLVEMVHMTTQFCVQRDVNFELL